MESRKRIILPDGVAVERYRIIGTDHYVYQATEPSPPSATGGWRSHHSLQSHTDESGAVVWHGRIGTAELPAAIDALPAMSPERSAAVREFHQTQYERAYRLIREWFPDIPAGARESMGEIHATIPPA